MFVEVCCQSESMARRLNIPPAMRTPSCSIGERQQSTEEAPHSPSRRFRFEFQNTPKKAVIKSQLRLLSMTSQLSVLLSEHAFAKVMRGGARWQGRWQEAAANKLGSAWGTTRGCANIACFETGFLPSPSSWIIKTLLKGTFQLRLTSTGKSERECLSSNP